MRKSYISYSDLLTFFVIKIVLFISLQSIFVTIAFIPFLFRINPHVCVGLCMCACVRGCVFVGACVCN